MIHDEVDKWVDEIVSDVFKDDRQPTLTELSDLFAQTKQKFFGACLQTLIEQKYAGLFDQDYAPCPKCGKRCKKRRMSSKELVTMQGPSDLKRPWFYCTDCSYGFSPLDKVLELSRKKYQFDVQRKSVKTSAEVPFGCASDMFEELTGQSLSDHFMHETFEEVGAPRFFGNGDSRQKCHTGQNLPSEHRRLAAGSGGCIRRCPRAHQGQDKTKRKKEEKAVGRKRKASGYICWQTIELFTWRVGIKSKTKEQFGKDLGYVASLIPQEQVRIALIGDGADWLWKHMTACFPQGRQVLDYYHCAEHIHKVAKAQYGEGSFQALEWVENTISRLFFAEIGNVIGGLRRMHSKKQ